jgi:hypothetical protein
MNLLRPGLLWVACIAIAGCDLDAADDATGPYYQECKTKGVWIGGGLMALVRPNGKAQLILPNGFQYQGTVEGGADGGIVCDLDRRTFRAALPPGTAFPDGATGGEGKVKGSIYVDTWLDMSLDIKTSAGTIVPVTASLSYDPVHRLDASLDTIAGAYLEGELSVSLDPAGRLFGQDAGTGCVVNGTLRVIEGKFNMYEVELKQESCTADLAAVNGLTGEGLAYYRPDSLEGADQLTLAVVTPAGTRLHSSVWVLVRD